MDSLLNSMNEMGILGPAHVIHIPVILRHVFSVLFEDFKVHGGIDDIFFVYVNVAKI